MNIPEELKYTSEHEWIKLDGDFAYIGISDFAQKELGDIVFLDINTIGKDVKAGEIFGSVEAVKTVSDLFMPVDAEVIELNPGIESNPELVNTDPYGHGWIIKVKVDNTSDVAGLLSAADYKKIIGV